MVVAATATTMATTAAAKSNPTRSGGNDVGGANGGGGGGADDGADLLIRLAQLEEKVGKMEEEVKRKDREIHDLRDRLEEEEYERRRVEERLKAKMEEEGKRKEEEIQKLGEKVSELEKSANERRTEEQERRQTANGIEKHKAVILTDSNGKGTTEATLKNHIPRSEREKFQIQVDDEAYTTGEALLRVGVGEGKTDVRGAIVVADTLTNDIRGSRNATPASPQELVRRVDRLRQGLLAAGAAAVVICEAKPMQCVDVTQHNILLSEYLRNIEGGFGCRTQIRKSYLKDKDGFHIRPEFGSILDRTYACAVLGVNVPCPTPLEDFTPDHVRRRWEREWPRVGRGWAGRAPVF